VLRSCVLLVQDLLLACKTGILHELVSRNPAQAVETRSTSDYRAIVITPQQTGRFCALCLARFIGFWSSPVPQPLFGHRNGLPYGGWISGSTRGARRATQMKHGRLRVRFSRRCERTNAVCDCVGWIVGWGFAVKMP
jgi:hypothetical protein